MRAAREGGFTLVELMVALLIFGMLSAAGVALLSFSVSSQAAATERLGDLSQLRRASALMAADLAQAAPRVHRGEDGALRPAFVGGSGDGLVLALVRRGWENVDGAPRASLQRVEWRLSEGKLVRQGFAMVDGAAPLAAAALVDDVARLRLRYREPGGEWRARWDPEKPDALPVAVELVVERADGAPVRQLFVTGTAR